MNVPIIFCYINMCNAITDVTQQVVCHIILRGFISFVLFK